MKLCVFLYAALHWVAFCILLVWLPILAIFGMVLGALLVVVDTLNKWIRHDTARYRICTSSANLLELEKETVDEFIGQNPNVHYSFCDQMISVDIDGTQIPVQSHSVKFFSPTSQPSRKIIFVHGANSGPMVWLPCIPMLVEDGYEVHCLALPGFGESLVSDSILHTRVEHLLDFLIDYVKKYMDQNGVSRAYVVGHSFGAFLASVFCCRYPQYCESVVLANGPGIFPILGELTIYWCILFKGGFPNFFLRQIGSYVNTVLFAYCSLRGWNDPNSHRIIAQMTCAESFGESITSRFVYFDGFQGRFHCTVLSELLSCETSPIAMIWGIEDHLTPLQLGTTFANFGKEPLGVECIDAWHNPMCKGTEFAMALLRIVNNPAAKHLKKVNPNGKKLVEKAVKNVYASFCLSETKYQLDTLVSSINAILNNPENIKK
jgi:pimeloyl-ACP methyl ester carboxylesterase